MAARITVRVTLATDEYDWGIPAANKVTICWSASKIHENESILNQNDTQILENSEKSITVNVSDDKGKTESHSFVKTSDGFINVFILQGNKYYRIGKKNVTVKVTAVTGTNDALGWTQVQSGSVAISATQFASKWVLVKAQGQGSDWGNNNSCNHRRSGGTQVLKSNVNSIYDCALKGVQAFDYYPDEKKCKLFKSNAIFSPTITHTSGRSKPVTQCYMLESEYEKLKKTNSNIILAGISGTGISGTGISGTGISGTGILGTGTIPSANAVVAQCNNACKQQAFLQQTMTPAQAADRCEACCNNPVTCSFYSTGSGGSGQHR